MNSLNDLTGQTNGGRLTVVGTTTSTATNVTINGTNASLFGDAAFGATNMPRTASYTAIAKDTYGRRSTNTVTVSLSTNSTFLYDGNGNLTNDGLRNFVYDDENQLIQVSVSNQWKSQFSYDGKMRRRIRREFTWTNSAWALTNTVYYVYDGNLVIQERDQNNLPTATYTRGKDLSGSFEGAGGIGGLLARTDATFGQTAFYHADGNGNVTMLINSSNAIVAKYLYNAFGNTPFASGPLADANLYRFSSKETDANSGLVYYLYRFYDPNLQRWVNRDPLGDLGFTHPRKQRIGNFDANLYRYCGDDPTDRIDAFGLDDSVTSTVLQCSRLPKKDFVFCICTLVTADEKSEEQCEKQMGDCTKQLQHLNSKSGACKCVCESAFPNDQKMQDGCKAACDCKFKGK